MTSSINADSCNYVISDDDNTNKIQEITSNNNFINYENGNVNKITPLYERQISNNAGLKYLPKWPTVDIDFSDITYSVPDFGGTKTILRNVNGKFCSNELTAIMGPSGSGKTTLLNILAGYKISKDSGDIYMNGRPRKLKTFKRLSRFIMQNEELDPYSTVREAMMWAANLKLGKYITCEQKNEIIDEILENLRLIGSENTISGRLSGGEKKRLSIAMELVNNPPVIFLDEPTTGLDDLSSAQCISLLRRIAHNGRTIICSIHSPSAKIFEQFDNVYVLAGGECVYQGSVQNIVPFVSSISLPCPLTYNPADFLMEISSGEYGIEYRDKMVTSVDNGRCIRWQPAIPTNDRSIAIINNFENGHNKNKIVEQFEREIDKNLLQSCSTNWEQFKFLLVRMMIKMWRDKSYIKLKFYMTLILAFLVGMIFQGCGEDATKGLFNYGFAYSIMFSYVYLPLMPVVASFPTELRLLKREYFNQWYNLKPYYYAMMLVKIPFMVFLAVIFLSITYLMSSQPLEIDRFIKLFSIAIITGLVSDSLGTVIASRFNIVNGQFIGPVTIAPLMLLAGYGFGFGVKNISILMKVAMNLSYLRHSVLGVIAALYGGDREDTKCPDTEMLCMFKKSQFLLKIIGLEDAHYLTAILALTSFYLLFAITGYWMIKTRLSNAFSNLILVQYGKQFFKKYLNFSSY